VWTLQASLKDYDDALEDAKKVRTFIAQIEFVGNLSCLMEVHSEQLQVQAPGPSRCFLLCAASLFVNVGRPFCR
jgi:hypothetical protein